MKKSRSTSTSRKGMLAEAYMLGKTARKSIASEAESGYGRVISRSWRQWFAKRKRTFRWSAYHLAAKRYLQIACLGKKTDLRQLVLLPTDQTVSIIVVVKNEEQTIDRLLNQLQLLQAEEIIVVINGSTDHSLEKVRRHPAKPILVHYNESLGHDVGRAVGAKAASGSILLFLDGDMVVPAKELLPFIYSISAGADVALNDITPYLPRFQKQDRVTILKTFVNAVMDRKELKANSMTAVPHAISRKAVDVIGCANLCVPPLAHVLAYRQGLRVTIGGCIDVMKRNRSRKQNRGERNPTADLIMGDHMEALHAVMNQMGARLLFHDQQLDASPSCRPLEIQHDKARTLIEPLFGNSIQRFHR